MLYSHSSRKKIKNHIRNAYNQLAGTPQMSSWRASRCQPNACDTLTVAIVQTLVSQLDSKVKSKRRGACKLSEGFIAWTTCTKWVNSKGEKKEVWKPSCLHGNCSVDTAITSSSQQIHGDKKVVFYIVPHDG